ncbi:hypothetical protein HZ326_28680 [Fusarium oxysporum f. sp. albedinis]|nr:hypothetical protein HZ326_28680 [Fusarium oxysporum f. sp. albedinis]
MFSASVARGFILLAFQVPLLSPIMINTIQVSPPNPFTDVKMALIMNNPAKSERITFLGKWNFLLVP